MSAKPFPGCPEKKSGHKFLRVETMTFKNMMTAAGMIIHVKKSTYEKFGSLPVKSVPFEKVSFSGI